MTTKVESNHPQHQEVNEVEQDSNETSSSEDQTTYILNKKLEGKQLHDTIRKQIEYYFSRENLATDAYLVSQMNSNMYVPIQIVANFKKVKSLTEDINLIVSVMRESDKVCLSEDGTLIRPAFTVTRNTVILRDIPKDTDHTLIKNLFGQYVPTKIQPDIGNTWFISFENDEVAMEALQYVRTQKFQDRPVQAGLKSENLLKSVSVYNPDTVNMYRPEALQHQRMQYGQRPYWDYQNYDPSWRSRRGGFRGGNRNRRGGYQKKERLIQSNQLSPQEKQVDNFVPRNRRGSKRGGKKQKDAKKKNPQSLPNFSAQNFPPLPRVSESEIEKFGYTGSYISFSKQQIIDVITQMKEFETPKDLPKDCIAVLETPITELELTKPLPKDSIENPEEADEEIGETTNTINEGTSIEQKPKTTKSFAEAAITAKDLKVPETRPRRPSFNRKPPTKGNKEQKKAQPKKERSDKFREDKKHNRSGKKRSGSKRVKRYEKAEEKKDVRPEKKQEKKPESPVEKKAEEKKVEEKKVEKKVEEKKDEKSYASIVIKKEEGNEKQEKSETPGKKQ